MPRTVLAPRVPTSAGLDLSTGSTPGDVANQHQFVWAAGRMVLVRNRTGAAITVTPRIAVPVDGITVTSRAITVAATTGEQLIGPFGGPYVQPDGTVQLDVSAGGAQVLLDLLDPPAY